MKYLLTCAAAAAAFGVVAMTPAYAEAGWRHGWWGDPGVGIYVGPRYGYQDYSYRYRPYYYNRYSYGYGPRWKYRYRDYD